MFTKISLLKDVLVMYKASEPCGDNPHTAIAYYDKILSKNPTMTFGEAVDLCGVDPNIKPIWLAWVIMWEPFRVNIDKEMQEKHLNAVKAAALDIGTNDSYLPTTCVGDLHDYYTDAERLGLLNKITDPMEAFQLYIKCENITDAEGAILESKFTGLLPTAEKELQDGVVERAKPTAIIPNP